MKRIRVDDFSESEGCCAERGISVLGFELTNGVLVEVRVENGLYRGIGRVTHGGVAWRDATDPLWPEIHTPDGWMVDRFEWLGCQPAAGGGVVLRVRPRFRVAPRMEWMEHGMNARINTASWDGDEPAGTDDMLTIHIRPDREVYGGVEYQGFCYGYEYHCPGRRIYQIEDKGTWEIGGSAETNSFYMRGGFDPPVAKVPRASSYTSAWTLPGIANPHVFQHLPFYAQMQGFTFQHDHERVLLTLHEWPSHVRSLFVKAAGEDRWLHFHQFCFDLTDQVRTPGRRVLVGALPGTQPHETANHYLAVRQKVQNSIRRHYGLRHDKTRPSAHVETWDIARMENLPGIFRQLAQWGLHRSFLMPLWRSNATEMIPRYIQDRDLFGTMGNMCCPLDLEIADCYGGWEGLRRALAPAVESGIEVYTWFGSHFSSSTILHKVIPDLFARDQTGQMQRNNYGAVLWAVNQRSVGYQTYLLEQYRKAGECGIRGIFRDSHFNMAADTINYLAAPYAQTTKEGGATADRVDFVQSGEASDCVDIQSMHDAEADIQRQFQQELDMLYYVESAGVLGTPMCGTRYDFIRGHEWMFSDMETHLNSSKLGAFGDDVLEAYFRALSVRLIYKVEIEINAWSGHSDKDPVSSWWDVARMPELLRAFAEVEPFMERMELLPDGGGVMWSDTGHRIIFAWKDVDWEPESGSRESAKTLWNAEVATSHLSIHLIERCADKVDPHLELAGAEA